ncbi:hypothetical protein FDP41_009926 [Naegleria fowleri]|uniref:Uncharacterized protein n=1 Tax=Naegleria fowleri TaxID=5763 RepID=A0A6A5ATD4_NAEFO|nr:uncharacterized protein FDP41_009926 [Naegleria fowleri]KAF0971703.1 hypothetical protein FDP41_009926 [Naegleria fowleri]
MSLSDWWKKASSSLFPKSSSTEGSSLVSHPPSSPLTSKQSSDSVQPSSPTRKPTTRNLLFQVIQYYYRQYKPTDQTLTLWRSGTVKYMIKPGSYLALGVVGVWLSDEIYRKLKVEKEAPSIFGKQEKIKPHTLIYETDWLLTDSMIIDEEDENQRKRKKNVIREYFFGSDSKKNQQSHSQNHTNEQHEHELKKFYAKWDYPNILQNQKQEEIGSIGRGDKIIHHVHIEKFHPYSNVRKGYWSTLLEYAIVHNAVENGSVSLRLIKEQRETFAAYVWRKLFTNREFEAWKNTKYWLHNPWNLNEIYLDLQQDTEITINNLKNYLEHNISEASVRQVILATLNSDTTLSPETLKENYYLYVSDEAFNEFKKSGTTKSTIRVTERSAKIGDVLFCVGSRSQNAQSHVPDVSSIRFVTHKPEPKYIEDFVQKEKKNHSPIWWRALVITSSLGFAIASVIG